MATKTLSAATTSSAQTFLPTDDVVIAGVTVGLTSNVGPINSLTVNCSANGSTAGLLQSSSSAYTVTVTKTDGTPGNVYLNAGTGSGSSGTTARIIGTGAGSLTLTCGKVIAATQGTAVAEVLATTGGTVNFYGDCHSSGDGTFRIGASDGGGTSGTATGSTITVSGLQWRDANLAGATNQFYIQGGGNTVTVSMASYAKVPDFTIVENTNSAVTGTTTIAVTPSVEQHWASGTTYIAGAVN